jgi:hypothetical protein
VESLNGAISGCVPFAGGVGAPGAAAADDSVAFVDSYPVNDAFGDWGTKIELVHPGGKAVALDVPSDVYDEDEAASISAGGSKVAFLRAGDSLDPSTIYVVDADGSGLRAVASWDGAYLSAPAISPDGGSIAYWCISPSPGDPAYSRRSVRNCGPLPDGSYRRSGVMLMNADGTDKRMIVIAPPAVASYGAVTGSLSWSPDGRWLTMAGLAPSGCVARPAGSCEEQVFAYRTDGSDLFNYLDPGRHVNYLAPNRQVTHARSGMGAAAPADPQFCGSSRRILYEAGGHAYLIDRDGTDRQRTALTLQTGHPACVSPAGGGGPPPTVNVMRVTVPAVSTLSYTAAKRRLQRAHSHVGLVKRVFSARIRRGHVITQYPHAGAHVHRTNKSGPAVKLVLSRGPRP